MIGEMRRGIADVDGREKSERQKLGRSTQLKRTTLPSHSDKNIKTLPADSPTEHSKVKREKLTRFQTPKRLRLVFRV